MYVIILYFIIILNFSLLALEGPTKSGAFTFCYHIIGFRFWSYNYIVCIQFKRY